MTHIRICLALGAAVGTVAACSMFDTSITNPNAIEEAALNDPASAPTQANGLNSAVTRMMTTVYGPMSIASDELDWVGSREYWGKLDAGDMSDPRNEYSDAAYTLASEARWLSKYTISRLETFDAASQLSNRLDLARSYVSGAVAYITLGDAFDDFIFTSDRTVPAAPIGEANMTAAYDTAIAFLDRALTIAQAVGGTSGVEMQRQILGLRARAKYSRAVWLQLRPARTTPASPLVNDAGANLDAAAALLVGPMATSYRYRATPTNANTGTNNIGSEMNSRQELRAGDAYINPDPAASNLRPLAGTAGIKLVDPVTNVADPVIAAAITECCRGPGSPGSGLQIPITLTSWKEMQLILAESDLATGATGSMQTRINAVRAVDGLPAWNGATPAPLAMLQHERRVNLFLQSRRLADHYRFNVKPTRWLSTNIAFNKACFIPITAIERQSNPLAPQPVDARPAACTQ